MEIIEIILAMGIIVAIYFIFLAKKYRSGDGIDKQIVKIKIKIITELYIVFILMFLSTLVIIEKISVEYLPIIIIMNIVLIAVLLIYLNRRKNERLKNLKLEKAQ